jgi:hypothetical protein
MPSPSQELACLQAPYTSKRAATATVLEQEHKARDDYIAKIHEQQTLSHRLHLAITSKQNMVHLGKVMEGCEKATDRAMGEERKARRAYVGSLENMDVRVRRKLGRAAQQLHIIQGALTRGINDASKASWAPAKVENLRKWLKYWLGEVEWYLKKSGDKRDDVFPMVQHQMVSLLITQVGPDTSDWRNYRPGLES